MNRKPSATSGFVVGVALMGLFRSVILHQILQWRQRSQFFDGLFLTGMLALVGLGVWLLIAEVRRGVLVTQLRFWSAALFSGGVFTVVEGLFQRLIHRIRQTPSEPHQTIWEVGFLILGFAMAAGGFRLLRQQKSAFKLQAYQFIRNTLGRSAPVKKSSAIRPAFSHQSRMPKPAAKQAHPQLRTRERTEASLDLRPVPLRTRDLREKLWEPVHDSELG